MPAVVVDVSRECRALVADTSLSGHQVTRELDVLLGIRGRLATGACDDGTELTSMVVLKPEELPGFTHDERSGRRPCRTGSRIVAPSVPCVARPRAIGSALPP